MKITLSFRWWQPCVNNNSMSTSCITRCIKSSSTMRRWRRSALNSSITAIVGKPWRNVIFDNVFSISSNNGWRIPKQYNILSGGWFAYICLTCCKILYTNRVLPFPSVRKRTYWNKAGKETPWLIYRFRLSDSYVVVIVTFNVGLGRAYPMALLSKVIHRSFFPFWSDKLTMEMMMMT